MLVYRLVMPFLFLFSIVLPAGAVYLNSSGAGQALIFPYYTVRSSQGAPYNTYISISNIYVQPAIAKVRFREGRNSRLVAEFNVYLTSYDMWTASLVPDGEGARLFTSDRSCTDPPIPSTGLALSNASFIGGDDGAGTGLERTKEGYLEVIEMGTLALPIAAISPNNPSFNCGEAIATLREWGAPLNGLTGSATLINVVNGFDATYTPDALAQLTSAAFFTAPGQAGTDFDSPQVDPVSHAVIGNFAYRMNWSRGIDAVSAALSSQLMENEFVLDAETNSKTDWVVALPTKRFYVTTSSVQPPFTAPFRPPFTSPSGFSTPPCEGVYFRAIGRDARATSFGPLGFNEDPPSVYRFCWSAGAFSIRTGGQAPQAGLSDVLGSTNTIGWQTSFLPATSASSIGGFALPSTILSGHGTFEFPSFNQPLISLPSSTRTNLRTGEVTTGQIGIAGYPVSGFMVRTLVNEALPCGSQLCQRNYASALPHRRTRSFASQ
jgi:hypothetical protein